MPVNSIYSLKIRRTKLIAPCPSKGGFISVNNERLLRVGIRPPSGHSRQAKDSIVNLESEKVSPPFEGGWALRICPVGKFSEEPGRREGAGTTDYLIFTKFISGRGGWLVYPFDSFLLFRTFLISVFKYSGSRTQICFQTLTQRIAR